jgi:phage/plasmid-associated DNA primase
VPTAALAEIGNDLISLSPGLDSLPPRFSEEALALRFSRRYSDDLRYVSAWGHWMRWDGLRWVSDDTLHVFDLARGICRAASAECGDSKERIATKIAAARKRLQQLSGLPEQTVVTQQWLSSGMLVPGC